ncbi:DUF2945 domain-containing protein [Novosphingobium colocasiae]|uniref:Hypervirulence associated protein TUDOR domain-containing protein n=1 Tax=Novosphingobium colocasiae TaxID=1256513 RepID=A0A918PGW3_9SPHN|nr:DUF2945 domain-containing protein [Novosphingobium colocasiae]GGZ07348.1 hypothetical protein GCM10011614_22840 [Novosphingobium colocasiae]
MAGLRVGSKVHWTWGTGTAAGRIVERFERRVSRTLKGKRIARNGTADNPAFLIEQDGGNRVLKRGSELQPA